MACYQSEAPVSLKPENLLKLDNARGTDADDSTRQAKQDAQVQNPAPEETYLLV